MRRMPIHRLLRLVFPFLVLLSSVATAWATPALVLDASTGQVLHAEEAGDPWYPASTTKLMTAFVVFEALRSGEVGMDTSVVLSRRAMRQASLHAGLAIGRAMRLEDALFAAIAGSANEVAMALAETVGGSESAFVERMNAAASRLGLTGSHFSNPNGLGAPDQHVTARDLALLGLAIDRTFPEHRRFFGAGGVVVDGQPVPSYNELLTRFPGTVGMKTGFLCASGRNIVALAERDGRRVMVVLLGATTERERAERAAQFMTEAFAGTLDPDAQSVADLPNATGGSPPDMRMRLCSDRTAAYERERDRLYPMGLLGEGSFLGETRPAPLHAITTWQAAPAVDVPLPTPRPAS